MPPVPKEQPLHYAVYSGLRAGLAPEAAVDQALMKLLADSCPHCGKQLEAFQREQQAGWDEARHPEPLAAAPPPFPPPSEAERRQAQRYVARLAARPQSHWVGDAKRSREKLRGQAVVEELLARARAALPGNPQASYDWGECAVRVSCRSHAFNAEHERYLAGLEARGWGFMANACRVLGDLHQARRNFARADALCHDEEVTDLEVYAEQRSFLSSLRCAERQFEEALDLAESAALLHRAEGNLPSAWRADMKSVNALQAEGSYEAGLDRALELLATIEREAGGEAANHSVYLFAHHAVVDLLALLHRYADASAELAARQPYLAQLTGTPAQVRLAWTEARIAGGLGDRDVAEAGLQAAQRQALDFGDAYTAALISLDLAMLYLEHRRFDETAELAAAITQAFRGLGVGREALAAWRLFGEAVAKKQADVALARRLARYLDQARLDPEYRFALTD